MNHKKKVFHNNFLKIDNLHFIPNNILTNFFKELTKYKKGKLQNLSLFFTPYFNLVLNISMMSIWSLTFLVSCEISPDNYLIDRKN